MTGLSRDAQPPSLRTPRRGHRCAVAHRWCPAAHSSPPRHGSACSSRCTKASTGWRSSPDTFESRCVAACLADPTGGHHRPRRGAIVGIPPRSPMRSAGGARRPRPYAPHVVVSCSAGPIVLDPHEVVVRPDGIRLASPPRAWFDCARDLDDARFERLTEWVLDHHAERSDAVESGPVADTTRSTRARPRQSRDEPAIRLAASGRIGARVACARCPRQARRRTPRSAVSVAAADGSADPSGRCRSVGQMGGRGGPRHLAWWPVRRAA